MTTTNWNPSPPNSPPCSRDSLVPSLDEPSTSSEYSDTIGETVFSKSWVLSLMVQAVAAVQDNNSGNQGNKETVSFININVHHVYSATKVLY